jgi:hypothetical protein
MISSRHPERGKGNAKVIIWLIIFVVVGYLLFQIVPPYVNDYQLHDILQTEARLFAARQKNAEAVRGTVWNEVQNLHIPAQREDITVSEAGRIGHIDVKYSVVVELPGYTLRLNFDPIAESPILN